MLLRLQSHAQSVLLPRYKDYREPPWSNTPYELSKEFWTVLAVRLSFVIVFQVGHLRSSFTGSWRVSASPVLD